MKKVHILTFHKEPSYGAQLQAYALGEYIKKTGREVRMINLSLDYRNRDAAPSIPGKLRMTVSKALRGYYPFQVRNFCFRRRFSVPETGCFTSAGQLERYPWSADELYITGSDQVWSRIPGKLLPSFFFSFLPPGAPRISYAASFGERFDKATVADMKPIAERFYALSVREQQGVEVCREALGMPCVEVVDPTLLGADFSPLLLKGGKKGGVVCFNLHSDPGLSAAARRLALTRGLRLTLMRGFCYEGSWRNFFMPSIRRWITNIAQAGVVVTDSFHGMVFALLFRREFVIADTGKKSLGRLANLLSGAGIAERIVPVADLGTPKAEKLPPIDFDAVWRRLEPRVEASRNFLKTFLQ